MITRCFATAGITHSWNNYYSVLSLRLSTLFVRLSACRCLQSPKEIQLPSTYFLLDPRTLVYVDWSSDCGIKPHRNCINANIFKQSGTAESSIGLLQFPNTSSAALSQVNFLLILLLSNQCWLVFVLASCWTLYRHTVTAALIESLPTAMHWQTWPLHSSKATNFNK